MSRIVVSMLVAMGFLGGPARAEGPVHDVSEEESSQHVEPSPHSSQTTLSLAAKVVDAAAVIGNTGSEPASGPFPETRLAFREASGKITGSFSVRVSGGSSEEILERLARAGAAVPELRVETLRLSSGRHDGFNASVSATVAEAPSSPSGVTVRAARAIERAWRRAGLRFEGLKIKRGGPIWKLSGVAREDLLSADRESWKTAVTAAATVFEEVAIESIRITEASRAGRKERILGFHIRAAKPRSLAPEGEKGERTDRQGER